MPGVISIDDEFTGLASGTTIAGRFPPTNDGGYSYVVDPNSSGATGGGSGDVKFSGNGVAVKIRSLRNSAAIQVVMDDKGGNEEFGVFTRDTYSTPYIRQGYLALIRTRISGGTNGTFTVATVTEYNSTAITGLQNVAWTFASNGINTVALESVSNNHRLIINNVVAASFTNSTWQATANSTKYGVVYHSGGVPSVMRMDRLTILDSVVIQTAQAYPIVTMT